MRPTTILQLLTMRLCWKTSAAEQFEAFLLPMLAYDPRTRATAKSCLASPWLAVSKPPYSDLLSQSTTLECSNGDISSAFLQPVSGAIIPDIIYAKTFTHIFHDFAG